MNQQLGFETKVRWELTQTEMFDSSKKERLKLSKSEIQDINLTHEKNNNI